MEAGVDAGVEAVLEELESELEVELDDSDEPLEDEPELFDPPPESVL